VLVLFALLAACGGGGGGGGGRNADADGDGVANAQDCASNDPTRWQNLNFQSVDIDTDGHRVNSDGQLCVGSSLPSTHFAMPASALDCDDNDASTWQMLPYGARDADGDGLYVAASGQLCAGAGLPAGYGAIAPQAKVADCDDTLAIVWRLRTTYVDADGDGVGAGRGEVSCVGAAASPGRSLFGYDPVDNPSDPAAVTVSNTELSPWQLLTP
jgi:hypothetical protein